MQLDNGTIYFIRSSDICVSKALPLQNIHRVPMHVSGKNRDITIRGTKFEVTTYYLYYTRKNKSRKVNAKDTRFDVTFVIENKYRLFIFGFIYICSHSCSICCHTFFLSALITQYRQNKLFTLILLLRCSNSLFAAFFASASSRHHLLLGANYLDAFPSAMCFQRTFPLPASRSQV